MFTGRYAVQWEYRMRVDRSLHPKTEVGGAIRHTLLLRITHPFGYAEASRWSLKVTLRSLGVTKAETLT